MSLGRIIFCGPEGYEPKAEPFVQAYAAWIPHNPELVTPELTAQGLKDTVRQMRRKAAGPDQWSAEALLLLPDMAWERLTELLLQVEQVGQWPAPLVQWRLTFLPKVSAAKTGVTHVAKVRPIAIGSLIYRAWSKHRFAQISPGLVGLLHQRQVGGLPGIGAEMMLAALQNQTDAATHPYGMSLDYKKAFDSVDYVICLRLFEALGIPGPILKALGAGLGSADKVGHIWPMCPPSTYSALPSFASR